MGTPTDSEATEIKWIPPMTESIGMEIDFDASDRSENRTVTDFIGRVR